MFVGNLNFQTTREELADLLSEVGTVVDVYLPADRATGRPRGFAFVEFADEDQAAKAIEEFDGREVAGRQLKVNPAEDRPRRPPGPRSFGPIGPPPGGPGPFGRRPGKSKGSRRGLRGKKRSL